MSIDADDLIKAFEALDLMNGQYAEEVAEKNEKRLDKEGNPYYETCERCAAKHRQLAEWLKELKQLREQTRWIPVSERLPKEDGEYLLFGKIDENEENYIFIGEYDSCGEQFGIWQEQFDRTTLGCLGSEFFEYSSVIAWQPLPKAYKEK